MWEAIGAMLNGLMSFLMFTPPGRSETQWAKREREQKEAAKRKEKARGKK